MAKKNNGKDFLFSDDCGFINGDDEGGESYRYSDGSGYYYGADGKILRILEQENWLERKMIKILCRLEMSLRGHIKT